MKYYKIVIGKEIIGVIKSFNFFVELLGQLISSTEDLGQFVEYEGKLYRDYWMLPIPNNQRVYTNALITEISREEYYAFIKAKQANEEIIIEDEPEEEPVILPQPIIEEPDAMLEYIRSSKINEMSHACNQIIEAGFDIELNGETHHFSLTTQDQLNLISLQGMLGLGMLQVPYHADGEICRFYSAAEMDAIISAATGFKIYHTTYYNALKNYINSLDNIQDIAAITYGVELPEEYLSDVLKTLL